MAVTIQDFTEFFDVKKNGTYKCPFCSKEQFIGNTASENNMAKLLIPASAGDAPPTVHHEFYSISCTNCGHTDFFHRIQVEEWLKSREPKKAEAGNG